VPFARWGLAELIVFTLLCIAASSLVGWLAWLGLNIYGVWLLGLVIFLFWLEIVWFFRDPPRTVPADPAAIVSPADGTIVELAEVSAEGFPEGKAFRVSIFLSIFNVHINRAPLEATVTRVRYFPGRFINAMNPESGRVNEQLWIDLDHGGMPMRVTQISGALARRIVCELKPGQAVAKGEKFGMIKLGSRTELYVPTTARFDVGVKVGDKVQGGVTVLLRKLGNLAANVQALAGSQGDSAA
jgi:phosphatidylserine decarboxylase